MNREKAIEYLERKGKLDKDKTSYNKQDEEEIDNVMTEGKIYGDPKAEIRW